MSKYKKQDLYVVRKFVMAKDAQHAIKKEKKIPVADVWMDEEWKRDKIIRLKKVGY